jgi:hypothetical protein
VQDSLPDYSCLKSEEYRKSYRYYGEARKIGIDNLDPCLGIGFVLKNGNDLIEFEKAFSSQGGGKLHKIASFFNNKD